MQTEEKTMEAVTEEVTTVEVTPTEKEAKAKMKLEDAIKEYFVNKDIVKERNERNKELMEIIEAEFEELNGNELILQLANGEYAKIFKKARLKEVLDKEVLAETINRESTSDQSAVSKDDLKTPWDFSMLTKQERITPKMIALCTETQTIIQTKLSKSKRKPKEKKND